jgi:hypothetical protein
MFGDGIKHICKLYWWFIIDVSDRQQPLRDHQESQHHQAVKLMPITKGNKLKLSLDPSKPNDKSWCTHATVWALTESLIFN